jgi:Mg-chelatase subunit ChlI
VKFFQIEPFLQGTANPTEGGELVEALTDRHAVAGKTEQSTAMRDSIDIIVSHLNRCSPRDCA